jgi:DNA polymerase III alpha subunit
MKLTSSRERKPVDLSKFSFLALRALTIVDDITKTEATNGSIVSRHHLDSRGIF